MRTLTKEPAVAIVLRTIMLAAGAVLVLAACGEDQGVTADPAGQSTPDAVDAPADEPADTVTGLTALVAVSSTDLGEVLVDGDGMTLYLFEPDGQSDSTCYDDCASAWPPLLADDAPQAGDGVDASLLGTTERTDGTMQVTYNGWPLYRWAQDDAPGDTNGQGVGDVWWVVSADGMPIRDAEGQAGAAVEPDVDASLEY